MQGNLSNLMGNNLIAGEASLTLIPRNSELLGQLLADTRATKAAK